MIPVRLPRSPWWIPVLAAVPVLGLPAGQVAAAQKPDLKLMAAVQACEGHARELLPKLVAVDSGSGDAEGLNAVGAIYIAELRQLGAEVRSLPPTPPAIGNNVLATVTGTGKGRVLLIAHMDTVFNRGDVVRIGPHWDGEHYVGPGAGDDKEGGVAAICALQSLQQVGFRDFGRIDVLLNASEEIGSPGSRELIRESAQGHHLAINLERGVPTDQVLVARKGSAVLTLEFTGKAAHSGLEPEKGRNAVLEAARVALELGKLSDPDQQTTVTVDILNGGNKTNVVPDHAVLKADVRAFSTEEFERVERAAAALAASPGIEGVTIRSSMERSFPPWPHAPSTDAVVARARRLYAELGRTLSTTQVGSSADVSLAAQTGIPSIDGFGIEGGGAHTPDDYVDFASFVPRVYLLARLLMDVGHDPAGLGR